MPAQSAPARRYTAVAIALHWASAICVLALICIGLAMEHGGLSPAQKFPLYQLHKSMGVTVLLLTALRIGWRMSHRPPPLPGTISPGNRRAASAGHGLLYVMLVGLPLTGWAVVSLSPFKIPTVLYGVVIWPHLPIASLFADPKLAESAFKLIHAYGAWLLIALLAAHVGAALGHQFVLGDGVLDRMLTRRGAPTANPYSETSR